MGNIIIFLLFFLFSSLYHINRITYFHFFIFMIRLWYHKLGGIMATLKDVAQKAGVTVTTVSRVINNRGYLSEKTKEKVRQAMAELNYRPNELARSLSRQTSNTIGIITPHISHPYFSLLISHLESAASRHNFKILLCNSKEDRVKETEYIDLCKSNRVAGVIFCGMILAFEKYNQLDFPFVAIECNSPLFVSTILCDNYSGGRMAAEHLIARGCRHLMHFSGSIIGQEMPGDIRARAFADVCQENSLPFHNRWIKDSPFPVSDCRDFIRQALIDHPHTDGIFASSDLIAAQVIQVCSDLRIRIPEDIRLVGFNDISLASLTTPPITTIRQPLHEMADIAVDALIKSSCHKTVPSEIVLPVTLIKRQST